MSLFERYLTVWVALCIVVGVILGHFPPSVFQAIGAAEIAKVNLPVAALIWLMIIPMLIKIDFAALGGVRQHWRGIGGQQSHQRYGLQSRKQARERRWRAVRRAGPADERVAQRSPARRCRGPPTGPAYSTANGYRGEAK